MVAIGSRVVGVLVSVVAISCADKDDGAANGTGGSSGASGASAGGTGGSSGAVASGGTSGRGGSGGAAGGGRAGSATGGTSTAGRGGLAGSNAVGGSSGRGSAGRDGDAGSAGASGEGGAANDGSLTWDGGGVITANDNDYGIQGSWFFETDCVDATPRTLPCTVPDPALAGPDAQLGWSVTAEKVCAKGIASQVINDPMTGMPAYQVQWGARLGFELNGTGAAVRQPYDAIARGIRGFTFDIVTQSTPPQPADLRVSFVATPTTADPHFVTALLPTANRTFLFSDALQGSWVTAPVSLDMTELTAITFQIYTNATAPKPFDFCISNVRVVE